METVKLLERLHWLGVSVEVSGDTILLKPGSRVPPELAEEVRHNKPALLAHLRQPVPRVSAQDERTPESQPSAGDALEASYRLGERFKRRKVPFVVCGYDGHRCTSCRGVPCLGSSAP